MSLIKRIYNKLFYVKKKHNHITYKFFGLRFKIKRKDPLADMVYSMPYYRHYMASIEESYGFAGKQVMEIGADVNLQCALSAIKLGAKEVWAANPRIVVDKPPIESIHILKELGEETKLENEKFDLIYGFALLEHVLHPRELAAEVARLLKPGGHAYLSGSPLWLGPRGHHVYLTVNGRDYHFPDEKLFAPWEHLIYDNLQDFAVAMRNRIPDEDIGAVYTWVYESDIISRLSMDDIVNAFKNESRLKIKSYVRNTLEKPNIYYEKLFERHGGKLLNADSLDIYCTKR